MVLWGGQLQKTAKKVTTEFENLTQHRLVFLSRTIGTLVYFL